VAGVRVGIEKMRSVLAIAVVAALSVVPTLASQGESKAVGEFCGTYSNGNRYQDVKTEFKIGGDGRLSGVYEFEDSGVWESGTLDPAALKSDRSAEFVWRDKYGAGRLILQFKSDFSSFSGAWSSGENPVLDWNGKRKCTDKGTV
jgi:hypothetical protein